MTRTYQQIKAEIEKLTKEAEAQREVEVQTVLADIRAKVAEYGFTDRDVFGRKRNAGAAKGQGVQPKYRDPKSGLTWSGRGRAPLWIRDAKNRDRFLIKD